MNAASSLDKLIKSITGCRCGTEVFAISIGIFAVSLVLFFFALRALKKAKLASQSASAPLPNASVNNDIIQTQNTSPASNIDLEETIKDLNAAVAANDVADFEEFVQTEHDETQIHAKS